jgi:cytochrome c oxidase subunit IV
MATGAPNVAERAVHRDEEPHPGDHAHPGEREYVVIALILAIITAAEVATYYFEDQLGRALVPLLMAMMTVKFAMVVMWFMHLKFDSRLFSRIFVFGLALAVGVYVAALATFRFF